MDSKTLNKKLITQIENIREIYAEEISWQEGDDTGSHIIFGDVFTPYIEQCLLENNEIEIDKCFSFIEDVLSDNNQYANEVIAFSVLEKFVFDNKEKAMKFMLPKTLKLFKEIMSYNN